MGNLVEHYPPGGFKIEVKNASQVPCNGFPLTVLVRCYPYNFRFGSSLPELTYNFCLFFRNFILGSEIIFNIDSEILLLKIPDMPETRYNPEIFLSVP